MSFQKRAQSSITQEKRLSQMNQPKVGCLVGTEPHPSLSPLISNSRNLSAVCQNRVHGLRRELPREGLDPGPRAWLSDIAPTSPAAQQPTSQPSRLSWSLSAPNPTPWDSTGSLWFLLSSIGLDPGDANWASAWFLSLTCLPPTCGPVPSIGPWISFSQK